MANPEFFKNVLNVDNIFGSILSRRGKSNQTEIPSAEQLWTGNDIPHTIMLWVACVAAILVLFLCAVHIYYTVRYTSQESIRSNLYFLIFMSPVTAMTSLVGMFIPRSADFLYTVNLSYYMLCLFMVVRLMFTMFGSRKALVRYLRNKEKNIKLAVPPYFQWMRCLPEFEGSNRNLVVVESLILQTVIVRILLQVTDLVVFFELKSRDHKFFTASHIIGMASMFIAFYFVYVVIDLGKERLAPYKYAILFRLNDVAQTLSSMQKFVIDIVVGYGGIQATAVMSANSVGVYYLNFALCLEMLILSLIATYVFHPSKTLLFDQYVDPRRDNTLPKLSPKTNIIEISTASVEQEHFLDTFDTTARPLSNTLVTPPGSPVPEARTPPSTGYVTDRKGEEGVGIVTAPPSTSSAIQGTSRATPVIPKRDRSPTIGREDGFIIPMVGNTQSSSSGSEKKQKTNENNKDPQSENQKG